MTYTALITSPECFSQYLTLTYKGSKNCIDVYTIDSVKTNPKDKIQVKIDFIYGQIYVDNLRNTVLVSMEEKRPFDFENKEAARSVPLTHMKGKWYRGDVIDTKLFNAYGSICDFHFIE